MNASLHSEALCAPCLNPVEFRKAVSLFTTGVVIVSSDDGDGGIHGTTVNSFTSVSLGPPTVLISLKEGRMHKLIRERGRYGISILSEGQQGFSSHFAGRPNDALKPSFDTSGTVPVLHESLAWFECHLVQRIQVRDHTLFVAEVVNCGRGDGAPLVFFGSQFHCQMQPA
jgi:flavin reductase (DIM6/NTAB) family NADH-FMN oxidoreductase RutF